MFLLFGEGEGSLSAAAMKRGKYDSKGGGGPLAEIGRGLGRGLGLGLLLGVRSGLASPWMLSRVY